MAAVDYDARSFKKALAQRGTCIDASCSILASLRDHGAVVAISQSRFLDCFARALAMTGHLKDHVLAGLEVVLLRHIATPRLQALRRRARRA